MYLPKLSPVSLACVTNKNEATKSFLQHPNFNFSTLSRLIPNLEMSPLVAAVVGNHGTENRNLLLLSFFADYVPLGKLAAMSNTPDKSGDVPLLVAANTASPEVVELLMDKLQSKPNILKSEQSEAAERQAKEVRRVQRLGGRGNCQRTLTQRSPQLEELTAQQISLTGTTEASKAAIHHEGTQEELTQIMDLNRALKFSIDESWKAAEVLLEEPDLEKKRRGGKTPSVKNLQEFSALKKPTNVRLSKLALCLCHILKGGNIGSTDPNTYDPKTDINPPSYWSTFQRSARNLKIGSKVIIETLPSLKHATILTLQLNSYRNSRFADARVQGDLPPRLNNHQDIRPLRPRCERQVRLGHGSTHPLD
jgi:hypothetical protein